MSGLLHPLCSWQELSDHRHVKARTARGTPRDPRNARVTSSRSPAGTAFSKAVTVFFPSCKVTKTTIPAMPRAATASAFTSQGIPKRADKTTRINPAITTEEDQMSVEKCRASASRAWLSYFLAALASECERPKSTRIEMPMIRNAQMEASTSTLLKNSLKMASEMIQTQVSSHNRVSISADRFSTLPYP